MSGLTVETLRDAGALAALREDWNRLVDASVRPNVFLTWEWLHAWWTHFGQGHTLNVLVVRDPEGGVAGIAPFFIEREGGAWPMRVLKFLGTRLVSSDYLDLLAKPGREREVAVAVLRAIREDRDRWDLARLSDLLEDAVCLQSLGEEARGHGCAVEIVKDQWCPYLALAATSEEYFQALGRSKRSRLKRAKKA